MCEFYPTISYNSQCFCLGSSRSESDLGQIACRTAVGAVGVGRIFLRDRKNPKTIKTSHNQPQRYSFINMNLKAVLFLTLASSVTGFSPQFNIPSIKDVTQELSKITAATFLSSLLLANTFSPILPANAGDSSRLVGEIAGSGIVFKDTLNVESFDDPKVSIRFAAYLYEILNTLPTRIILIIAMIFVLHSPPTFQH